MQINFNHIANYSEASYKFYKIMVLLIYIYIYECIFKKKLCLQVFL